MNSQTIDWSREAIDDSQISLLPLGFSLHFLGIACLFTSNPSIGPAKDRNFPTSARLDLSLEDKDEPLLSFFTHEKIEPEKEISREDEDNK